MVWAIELISFQLTAARRRLEEPYKLVMGLEGVSTHSRPKAAGRFGKDKGDAMLFQLTAARRRLGGLQGLQGVAGAFQLTAARRRLVEYLAGSDGDIEFQLTAARRRLVPPLKPLTGKACIALFR